jgi:hypothetical protein
MHPWRAVDPPAGGEDAADVAAQLGFCVGSVLDGRDRAPPSVKARHAHTNNPTQRGDGVVKPLG